MSNINVVIINESKTMCEIMESAVGSHPKMQVSATVNSGKSAVGLFNRTGENQVKSDVIVLDYQIGQEDGLDVLEQILKSSPKTNVLLAIPKNDDAAKISAKALTLGAKDYIVKINPADNVEDLRLFKEELVKKIQSLGNVSSTPSSNDAQYHKPSTELVLKKLPTIFMPTILAISSSTGGPSILNDIMGSFKGKKVNMPIFITQHMPRDFTGMLAEQIKNSSGLQCFEAEDGMVVEDGMVFIAPGDYHMTINNDGNNKVIRLNQGEKENFCRPAADPMLRSLVEAYGGNKILSVVLTGMGKDACLGCKAVSDDGGVILAQDYESSAVWGMPGAVVKEEICSRVESPAELVKSIIELSRGKIS